MRPPAFVGEPSKRAVVHRRAVEIELLEHLAHEHVEVEHVLAARADREGERHRVRPDAGKLEQVAFRLGARRVLEGLDVEAVDDRLRDTLDEPVPVADAAGADGLERRGLELRWGRRRVVHAVVDLECVAEGRREVCAHRVEPPKPGVLGADHVEHAIEHREAAFRLGAVVVRDGRGHDRVTGGQRVKGPEVVVEAETPLDLRARFLDLGVPQSGAGLDRQFERRLLHRAPGSDLRPGEAARREAEDFDERVALAHLGRHDVVPQLESEVVGRDDLGPLDRDRGDVHARRTLARPANVDRGRPLRNWSAPRWRFELRDRPSRPGPRSR